MAISNQAIKEFWDSKPCGTDGILYPIGSLLWYEAIAQKRDAWDSLISEYAQFDKWAGKKVLEVGCGAGSDLVRFAQAGAEVAGIDLSPKSVLLARERLRLYKCSGVAIEADGESIPYKENTFDLAYSWGVAHHAVHPEKVIQEIYRVTKSGGEICAMVYNRHSIVALQMWVLFGLLKLKPFRSISEILASCHESVGTRAYTVKDARQMFLAFKNLKVDVRVTSYDLRYSRNKFMPMQLAKFIPQSFGWNIIIQGTKP